MRISLPKIFLLNAPRPLDFCVLHVIALSVACCVVYLVWGTISKCIMFVSFGEKLLKYVTYILLSVCYNIVCFWCLNFQAFLCYILFFIENLTFK